MADLDEDIIRPSAPGHSANGSDDDDDDGTADFSALSSLLRSSKLSSRATTATALPRRGDKDFEPHGTTHQADVLARSRQEMHDALGHLRVHRPDRRIRASYDRRTGRTRVLNPRSKLFQGMGRTDRWGTWLRAEEALYLVERGDLDVWWWEEQDGTAGAQRSKEGELDGTEGDDLRADEEMSFEGIPFSLQTAYAVYVGDVDHGVSLEQYNVYANLKRGGFAVFRGPAWEPEDYDKDQIQQRELLPVRYGMDSAWSWLYSLRSKSTSAAPHGPLLGRGPFRQYSDIYRRLDHLVPWHDPSLPSARESRQATNASTPSRAAHSDSHPSPSSLRVSYYVYKPREGFRKSAPGPPDFRIAIVDARETAVPIIEQIDGLLASTPYNPPSPPPNLASGETDNPGKLYARLKHGYRNVILAIVDQGVVSYLRISDAGFGKEKLYDGAGRSKFGNKGGKRGGRGRGKEGGGRGGRARRGGR